MKQYSAIRSVSLLVTEAIKNIVPEVPEHTSEIGSYFILGSILKWVTQVVPDYIV